MMQEDIQRYLEGHYVLFKNLDLEDVLVKNGWPVNGQNLAGITTALHAMPDLARYAT